MGPISPRTRRRAWSISSRLPGCFIASALGCQVGTVVRLGKRESDLARYVGELQVQMEERESDWWEKQLGHPVAAAD